MNKYEFHNEEKSMIRHNLVPNFLIEIIKLSRPNDYESEDIDIWSDIFDEKTIKGHHFVFKVLNEEGFEDIEDYTQIRSILKRASKWYQAKVAIGFVTLEKYKPQPSIFEDDNFKLMKSDYFNWWLVAHKESNIIIEFEQGDFNDSQRISELTPISNFMQVVRILREVGEWLAINHPNKI